MGRRATNEKKCFALPWLRESQYDAVRAESIDIARLLPTTYEAWRLVAEETERRMTKFGFTVVRVDVDLDELRAWCDHRRRPLDIACRFDFAKWKAGAE